MADNASRGAVSSPAAKLPSAVLNACFALLVLMGVVAQLGTIAAYRRGDMQPPEAIMVFAFAVALTIGGLWFFYQRYVVTPAREARAAKTAALYPNAPWMLNDAWAQRKVIDRSSLAASIFLWIWSAGWLAGCSLIWGMNSDKIIAAFHASWSEALLAAFLAFCGLLGVVCAVAMTLKWWRYGQSTLHIDTLPGYLGNRFRGTIAARLPADTPLELECACEHVTVLWERTPKGGRRKVLVPEPLWSHCWPLERERMTRKKDGSVIIPIDVALPEDKPPYALDAEGGGIRWMLRMRTDFEKLGLGKDNAKDAERIDAFSAEYAIPVYARD